MKYEHDHLEALQRQINTKRRDIVRAYCEGRRDDAKTIEAECGVLRELAEYQCGKEANDAPR